MIVAMIVGTVVLGMICGREHCSFVAIHCIAAEKVLDFPSDLKQRQMVSIKLCVYNLAFNYAINSSSYLPRRMFVTPSI